MMTVAHLPTRNLKDLRVSQVDHDTFIIEAWSNTAKMWVEVLLEGKYSSFSTADEAVTAAKTLDTVI